jgi:hypothetical protein
MSEAPTSGSGAARFLEMLQEEAYRKWRVGPLRNVPGFNDYDMGRPAEFLSERVRQQTDYTDLIFSGEFAERLRQAQETGLRHPFRDLTVPTKFENPMIYLVISGASARVHETALRLNRPLPAQPLVGTMPTGDVHAYTVPVPEEMRTSKSDADHLIIFDWQFFLFAHLLSKAIARAFPSVPSREYKGFSRRHSAHSRCVISYRAA